LLTVEDIANRLLNCGERTVIRDIKALKEKGVCLPLRSTIKEIVLLVVKKNWMNL
jgi:hypothetical protein